MQTRLSIRLLEWTTSDVQADALHDEDSHEDKSLSNQTTMLDHIDSITSNASCVAYKQFKATSYILEAVSACRMLVK